MKDSLKNFKKICILWALCSVLTAVMLAGCSEKTSDRSDIKTTKEPVIPSEGIGRYSEMPDIQPITRDNIIINAYLVPLYDETVRKQQFEYMKNAEIDVISHIYVDKVWTAEGHTADKYLKIMKEAAEYGFSVYTRDIRIQESLKYTDEELTAIASEYKDIPGNIGFYVCDEPFDPNPYARVENTLRKVFPNSYVNINFLPRESYPEGTYYKRLTDFGSLVLSGGTLSLDTYNFGLDGGVNESSLFKNYNDLRTAALKTGKNTAVYVQSVGYINYRRPSENDLRYNMMAALSYGVKELKFFTWGKPTGVDTGYTDSIFNENFEPTNLYQAVCEINKKIHNLGKYLAQGDAVAVYHTRNKTPGAYDTVPEDFPIQKEGSTDVILSVIQSRTGNDQYLMVVNKNIRRDQTVSLKVADIKLKMVDDKTGKLIDAPVENGILKFDLVAGDGALFKIEGKKLYEEKNSSSLNLAADARLFSTSAAGDGISFLCDIHDGKNNDGKGAKIITQDGKEQYITFDLGAVKTLNRVDIYPYGKDYECGYGFPVGLSILISEDGRNWNEVVQAKDYVINRSKVPVFKFASSQARYVRIAVTKFTVSEGMGSCRFGEVEIYNDDGTIPDDIPTMYKELEYTEGENIALNKPLLNYSSSCDHPEWGCNHDYINDGNKEKVWSSELSRHTAPENSEWIVIDLMSMYDVEKVVLTPQKMWNGVNVFPNDYEIQVSQDGQDWVTVKKVTGDNTPMSQEIRNLTFEPVKAQYVKLLATKLTRNSQTDSEFYGIEIAEMEIYGRPSK